MDYPKEALKPKEIIVSEFLQPRDVSQLNYKFKVSRIAKGMRLPPVGYIYIVVKAYDNGYTFTGTKLIPCNLSFDLKNTLAKTIAKELIDEFNIIKHGKTV